MTPAKEKETWHSGGFLVSCLLASCLYHSSGKPNLTAITFSEKLDLAGSVSKRCTIAWRQYFPSTIPYHALLLFTFFTDDVKCFSHRKWDVWLEGYQVSLQGQHLHYQCHMQFLPHLERAQMRSSLTNQRLHATRLLVLFFCCWQTECKQLTVLNMLHLTYYIFKSRDHQFHGTDMMKFHGSVWAMKKFR